MRNSKRAKTAGQLAPSSTRHAGLIGACTAALGRMAASLRDLGSARPAHMGGAERVSPRSGDAIRIAPHLSRLGSVVESAAQHVERAEQCHRGAGIRIDAALYELEQLRLELQSVVDPAMLLGTSRLLEASAAEKTRVSTSDEPERAPIKAGQAKSARSAA